MNGYHESGMVIKNTIGLATFPEHTMVEKSSRHTTLCLEIYKVYWGGILPTCTLIKMTGAVLIKGCRHWGDYKVF